MLFNSNILITYRYMSEEYRGRSIHNIMQGISEGEIRSLSSATSILTETEKDTYKAVGMSFVIGTSLYA